jgi:hypothetical protein
MDVCFRHPERAAVEHCEVCAKAVCASCLWYAESGERLCPEHAAARLQAGEMVFPPERYQHEHLGAQASAARASTPGAPYQGRSADVLALIAAVLGVSVLASCFGGAYIFPLIAFGLGVVAWYQSRDSLDLSRTRWLAGIGMGTSGCLILMVVGVILVYCGFFAFAFLAASTPSTPPLRFPTPTP